MGASNFTPAEFAWLQEQYVSDDVRNILETGGHGKHRQAANLLTARYTLHFTGLLPPETTEEFAKRKAWKTIAEREAMEPRVEETEAERVERLTKAPTFTQLPEEIKAKYEAKARKLEVDDANGAGSSGLHAEALRAAKARQLPEYVKSSLAHWQRETGYIFFCYACGIDEFGQLSAFSEWVGEDAQERSFEQVICQAGWSIENLRAKYLEFGRSIFDPGHRSKEDAAPDMGRADAGAMETIRHVIADVANDSSSEEETPGPVLPLGPEDVETITHMVVNGSAMTLAPEPGRATNAMDAEINEAGGSAQEASSQDPGQTETVSGPGEATFPSEDTPPSEAEHLPYPSPVQTEGNKQAAKERGQQVAPSRGLKKAKGDCPPSVAPAETAAMPVQVSPVATVGSSQATGTGRSQRQRTHSAKAMGFASLAEKARFEEERGIQDKGKDKVTPANAKELKRACKNETGRATNKRVKGATCHGFGPDNFKMVLHYKVGIAGRWGALCLNCHRMAYPDQAQLTDVELDLIEWQRREDEVLAQLEKDRKMAERLQRRADAEAAKEQKKLEALENKMARDQKRADESAERLETTASQLASMQASHEMGDSGVRKIARRVGRTARKSSGGKRPKRFLDDNGRKEPSEDGSGDEHDRKQRGGGKDANIDGKADEDIDVVLLRIVIWYDVRKQGAVDLDGDCSSGRVHTRGAAGMGPARETGVRFWMFLQKVDPEEDICDWRGPLIWHDTLIVPEEGMRSLLLKRSFITQCPGIKWELRALLTGEFGPDGGPIIDLTIG
ncbi:hypothetical protein A0H81_01935 [Grifola frondosa]|uniref:Uncharacterized protein n=1 Tax=Grifola frondosa TaxID=5627 RepID=A0A1C7ML32_GRIFR|nr:hypothetical protein A0H81_01935 [Grifola frondosa]